MANTIAPVLPIRPQAAPSPSDLDWAARVAAFAFLNGVTPRGCQRMMAGFPPECVDATVSSLAALRAGAS